MIFSNEEKGEGIDVCRVLDYREARGEARGLENMSKLIRILCAENRLDELKLIAEDENVRREYFIKYRIEESIAG